MRSEPVVSGQDLDGDARAPEALAEVEGLVGHERAQRVHKDARPAARDGLAGGVQVEDERLAAARRHDRQARAPGGEHLERAGLRRQQRSIADELGTQRVVERGAPEARELGAAGGRDGRRVLLGLPAPRLGLRRLGALRDGLTAVAQQHVPDHELGLVRPCQVSLTASKTTSTTPSQAQARSASGARSRSRAPSSRRPSQQSAGGRGRPPRMRGCAS